MDSAFWALCRQFRGAPHRSKGWLYMTHDPSGSGGYRPMEWTGPRNPYAGSYRGVADPGAAISYNFQVAGKVEATLRGWEAPRDGRVLVQCRAARSA